MQIRQLHASFVAASPSVLSAEQFMLLLPAQLKHFLTEPSTSPHNVPNPLKVGVCVSGGADSMILAHLLKHAKHPLSPLAAAFEPHAFIVDHRARAQSEKEALSVKSLLSEMNVQSDILTMLWPRGTNFKHMTNFERVARRERYQLIAEAALSHGIRYLFTGHHYDDQIETLMGRLIRDQHLLKSSFLGIAEIGPIPECQTVFGAQRASNVFANIQLSSEPIQSVMTSGFKSQHVVNESYAGLQLVRPLLTVPKHRLLTTCAQSNVSFVNDPTNFDPTLTTRNAIRYLRFNHRLPYALSGDRLINVQRQASVSHDKAVELARRVSMSCKLHTVSKNGLYVAFELPASYTSASELDLPGFAYFLARVAELVSYLPGSRIPSLLDENFVNRFLHKCCLKEDGRITTCGVMFDIVNRGSVENGRTINIMAFREPLRRPELKHLRRMLDLGSDPQRSFSTSMYTTKWLLWDNRTWIRALSTVVGELQDLRIIPSDEIYKSSCDLHKAHIKYAKHFLKKLPLKARGTVPILCRGSYIIGLPTYDKMFHADNPHKVAFEVAYPVHERCYDFFGQSAEKVGEAAIEQETDATLET